MYMRWTGAMAAATREIASGRNTWSDDRTGGDDISVSLRSFALRASNAATFLDVRVLRLASRAVRPAPADLPLAHAPPAHLAQLRYAARHAPLMLRREPRQLAHRARRRRRR